METKYTSNWFFMPLVVAISAPLGILLEVTVAESVRDIVLPIINALF